METEDSLSVERPDSPEDEENEAIAPSQIRFTQDHAMAISLLLAMEATLDRSTARAVARRAFDDYMIKHYTKVLGGTRPGSQERFDAFREYYEAYAECRDYIDVVDSTPRVLRVRYRRCPFHDTLTEGGVGYFTSAFCEADRGFTEACLPGVRFRRQHELAADGHPCDHEWVFECGGDDAGSLQ